MNPEWSLQNRSWVIANLRGRGHRQVTAEEAADTALEEIEEGVRTSGRTFRSERHFACYWRWLASKRTIDTQRRPRQQRPIPQPLAFEWRVVYRQCLAQLEQRQQTILELYFWEGLKDREIGQRLWPGEPESTSLSRAHRERQAAQAALREVLLRAGMEAKTLDFSYGPLARLRRRHPELS